MDNNAEEIVILLETEDELKEAIQECLRLVVLFVADWSATTPACLSNFRRFAADYVKECLRGEEPIFAIIDVKHLQRSNITAIPTVRIYDQPEVMAQLLGPDISVHDISMLLQGDVPPGARLVNEAWQDDVIVVQREFTG